MVGKGELHEAKYDNNAVVVQLDSLSNQNTNMTGGVCQYSLHIFPTKQFEEDYYTHAPILFAFVSTMCCIVLIISLKLCIAGNNKNDDENSESVEIPTTYPPDMISGKPLAHGSIVEESMVQDESTRCQDLPFENKIFLENGIVNVSSNKSRADLFLETTVLVSCVKK